MTGAWRALPIHSRRALFDIAREREIALRPDIKSFHFVRRSAAPANRAHGGDYLKLSNGEIIELRANFQNETCKMNPKRRELRI